MTADRDIRASERAALCHYLAAQRRSVLAIVDGLDDGDLRRPVVPSGWTPLGLIEHLGRAERFWFGQVVAGAPAPADGQPAPFTSRTPAADVLAFYREQTARSDGILAGTSLDARPAGPVPPHLAGEVHTVRDVVLHMVEESARHAGHLDIARELLDGSTALGPR
ncbi:MAG TPA: DinB family protein [Mycobacteriales bacterium]